MFSAFDDQEQDSEPLLESHDSDASRSGTNGVAPISERDQQSALVSQARDIGPRNDDEAEPIIPYSTSNTSDLCPGHTGTQDEFQTDPNAAVRWAPPQRIIPVHRPIPKIQPKVRWPRDSQSLRIIIQRRRTEAKIDDWWANDRWMDEGFDEEESPYGMVGQETESRCAEQEERMTGCNRERRGPPGSDDEMTEPDEACGAIAKEAELDAARHLQKTVEILDWAQSAEESSQTPSKASSYHVQQAQEHAVDTRFSTTR